MSRLVRGYRLVTPYPATPSVSSRAVTVTAARFSSSSSSPKPKPPPRTRPSAPPPPFELVPTCPSPTCECAATPAMPDGLEIDRKGPLNGVVSAYAEQVLVCTGKDDWASRIEEENSGDNLAADLKELFGRGGTYSDPWHNISVLNASFPSSTPKRSELQTTSAYLLPSFKYVPFLPRVSFDSVQALAKGYLLPEKLHPMHDGLSPIHRDRLTRKEAYRSLLYGVRDVTDVLVLICGHGGRDMRCGVMGPVLRDEFEARFEGLGVDVARGPVEVDESGEEKAKIAAPEDEKREDGKMAARVGLISHIGGHKFAGNVIVYIPPGLRMKGGEKHPLAGKGIWYGRVEPKHVEGIVKETVLEGRVIADMFRGGIDENRKILRL
ncbi:altered inheritance of mitochondria protein 32 [Colletotrichum spaethianum]|uniref:Altered inheritance of mitochondria protein 32 n=1 Tax=Colletotrichum spaethianum TaxID=700344 RepID=A0AA37L2E8_9PEZI|nr:altered inheritance of mitochondria protein 32 [Colletotrichum spaethianum]GKT40736.1 altered inheritance of mitochondria protein 32 [Colletotrichum spaethianum]